MRRSTPRWPATSAAAAPTPASVPPSPTRLAPWPEGAPMLPNVSLHELPRAVQRLMARGQADGDAALTRRHFLKLAGAGGLALGAFPGQAATDDAAAKGGEALKPTQQPAAFVQIAPNGEVTVAI